jgi:hypothetical protein
VSKNVEEGLFLRAPEERAGRYRGWVRLSELRHVSHCCHGLSRNLTFPWLRGGRPFHPSEKSTLQTIWCDVSHEVGTLNAYGKAAQSK